MTVVKPVRKQPLFEVGEVLTFGTFDHELADLRELDGTKATVTAVHTDWDPYGEVDVDSQYGEFERLDPFNFIEAATR